MPTVEISDESIERMKKEAAVLTKLIKVLTELANSEARGRVLTALMSFAEGDVLE